MRVLVLNFGLITILLQSESRASATPTTLRQAQIAFKSDGVCGDLDQLLCKGPFCSVSHWMPPQFTFLSRVSSLEQVLNLFIRSL
jgi:hypothetical protein